MGIRTASNIRLVKNSIKNSTKSSLPITTKTIIPKLEPAAIPYPFQGRRNKFGHVIHPKCDLPGVKLTTDYTELEDADSQWYAIDFEGRAIGAIWQQPYGQGRFHVQGRRQADSGYDYYEIASATATPTEAVRLLLEHDRKLHLKP